MGSALFPRWDRETRDARFAELRRRQAREAGQATVQERLARADALLRSARELSPRGPGTDPGTDLGTDETVELWRRMRARFAR